MFKRTRKTPKLVRIEDRRLPAEGDAEISYSRIYEESRARLARLVQHHGVDIEDAYDVVQNVFAEIWPRWREQPGSFGFGYFAGAAVKQAALFKRREAQAGTPFGTDVVLRQPAHPRHNPDALLDLKEFRHHFDVLSSALPDRARETFLLVAISKLTYREAGESLGISEDAARKNYLRAAASLSEELQALGYDVDSLSRSLPDVNRALLAAHPEEGSPVENNT